MSELNFPNSSANRYLNPNFSFVSLINEEDKSEIKIKPYRYSGQVVACTNLTRTKIVGIIEMNIRYLIEVLWPLAMGKSLVFRYKLNCSVLVFISRDLTQQFSNTQLLLQL